MKTEWKSFVLILVAIVIGTVCLGITPAEAAAGESGVVNINTASAKQLTYLKGIGAKKAQAIVNYRDLRKFEAVDELTKVKGIGKKLVEKLRPHLVVQGDTTLKPKPKKKRKSRKSSD